MFIGLHQVRFLSADPGSLSSCRCLLPFILFYCCYCVVSFVSLMSVLFRCKKTLVTSYLQLSFVGFCHNNFVKFSHCNNNLSTNFLS